DAHVDLQTLWGPDAVELRERLCAATTPADRFRLLEGALMAHRARPLAHHPAVAEALEVLAHPDARTTVRALARDLGWSQRRFIELFTAEVGLTPKRFARIQRFQRALALACRSRPPDWARLALDCGYFDQSHLIRDFLAFSGLSPARYDRWQGELG